MSRDNIGPMAHRRSDDCGFKRRLMPLCQASQLYEKLRPFLQRVELGPGHLVPETARKPIGFRLVRFRWNPKGPRLSFDEFLACYNLVVY